jgi:hypothetical protein
MQPEQLLSRFHEAAGLHPLHPTTCPFAGSNLGGEPSAGAARGAPKGEAQGISEKLAAFTGAGGRPIGGANANALTAEGNAGRGLGRERTSGAANSRR